MACQYAAPALAEFSQQQGLEEGGEKMGEGWNGLEEEWRMSRGGE